MRYIVVVKPNAKRNAVEEIDANVFKISVTASPIDGKANSEMLALLGKHLHVAPSLLSITYGARAKRKIVELAD